MGGRSLGARAAALIRATPGAAALEPAFTTDARLTGQDPWVRAVRLATMFRYRLAAGRWYTPPGNCPERTSPSSSKSLPVAVQDPEICIRSPGR